jgi:hypothetical protein
MPFNRCNVGSEQGLIDDPVLGQGRDPLLPLQDVITDEGDIVVPVNPHRSAHRPDRCALCRHHADRPAAGGTPVDLEFAYTLSAQAKLVLTTHEV